MIKLKPEDQLKFCLLWYKDVANGDFAVVGYKHTSLPFGLRCSPALLMIALYKILILDTAEDTHDTRELKRQVYSLMYMDNGAFSCNDPEKLKLAYKNLHDIFESYGFGLQQFITNEPELRRQCNATDTEVVPECQVLGMTWDTDTDMLHANKLILDQGAASKRQVLASIASNYDPLNINGPLLNRARLFMHDLQCDEHLGWDDKLTEEQKNVWSNICKQVNGSALIKIPRFLGECGAVYDLVAFTDSSATMYGTVLYIVNARDQSRGFLLAKSKLICKLHEKKSIPSLELQAVVLGVQSLINTLQDLSGEKNTVKNKIRNLLLYTDNLVCLNWIYAHSVKLDKISKRAPFVLNRLHTIDNLCKIRPVSFKFCAGVHNPADCATRPISHKLLLRTSYHSCPDLASLEKLDQDLPQIRVPHPAHSESARCVGTTVATDVGSRSCDAPTLHEAAIHAGELIEVERYSSFTKAVKVLRNVIAFCDKLKKLSFARKNGIEPEDSPICPNVAIIVADQVKFFRDIVDHFNSAKTGVRKIPPIVTQLNVFRDSEGILRVKSKSRFGNYKDYPILISKKSYVAKLIVRDLHKKLSHAPLYTLLGEIRKQFHITAIFSFVKGCLRECVQCRKHNNRRVKLTQNQYRDFRQNPPKIPFKENFIDYIGPFQVYNNSTRSKVYILCISCTWSRAISLKVCESLSASDFLRAFELHNFLWGVPRRVYSDLGSQIVAGGKLISDFLKDEESLKYFEDEGVEPIVFDQYYKGASQLGGLVESCVKIVKRLLHGALGNSIVSLKDFSYIVAMTEHLANRRPVAFKNLLRDDNVNAVLPDPITPEMLLHGRELVSISCNPFLRNTEAEDPDWEEPSRLRITDEFHKLQRARNKLVSLYRSEFMGNLIDQSTNRKRRFEPVTHQKLGRGDLIMLSEPFQKAVNFPLAIVEDVILNDLQEVTDVIAKKGRTGEKVKRHVTSVIPLMTSKELTSHTSKNSQLAADRPTVSSSASGAPTGSRSSGAAGLSSSPGSMDSGSALPEPSTPSASTFKRRPQRLGALQSRAKTRAMINEGSV